MEYNTLSNDKLIHALERAGKVPDLELIFCCLERIDELEPALLELLRINPWDKYDIQSDMDPLAYGDIHAGLLLIAARSQAALPLFDAIFRNPERAELIEVFGTKIHHYGTVALPLFSLLMLDEDAFTYGRSTAVSIITQLAYNEPLYTPIVISTLQKLLPPLPEEDTSIVGDNEFNTMWNWAALELSNLGDKESQAQIKALYAVGAIETSLVGDYYAYKARLRDDETPLSAPYDIMATYEFMHHGSTLEALLTETGVERAAKNKWLDYRQNLEDEWSERDPNERQQAAREADKAAFQAAIFSQTHERTALGMPSTRITPKVGRNAPCPCGSGKKYKKCCGRLGK